VTTRLAWLGISQKAFADAIGMDKSRLSRAIRADAPRKPTLERIAFGLGLSVEELLHEDETLLLRDHPAIRHSMSSADAEESLSRWYADNNDFDGTNVVGHRSEEQRFMRRLEVRKALVEGRFCLDFVREMAQRYGVSDSQIHSDRSFLKRTEGLENRTSDEPSSSG